MTQPKTARLTFGERGESASLWRAGNTLTEVKAVRRAEGEAAANALGAEVWFLDAGDYPLTETPELVQRLVDLYRELQPDVVLTHSPLDPYNVDHVAQPAGAKPSGRRLFDGLVWPRDPEGAST